VIEALATAVGAGVVLGGVAAGIWGLARGSSRTEIEESALFNGYAGGDSLRWLPWSTWSCAMVSRDEVICLHRDWKQSFRNADVGIAVGSAVVVGGVLIFRHSGEAALQAVAIIGFIAALVAFTCSM